METLISIIIPFYNRGYIVKDTLTSVLAQTHTNWEVIIVDDGSTNEELDNLKLLIADNEKIKLLKRTSLLKGPSACRNAGIETAAGKYIVFLDTDDILDKDCIKNRLELMCQSPEIDYAVFNMWKFKQYPGDMDEMFSLHPSSGDNYLSMFMRLQIPWQVMAPIWKKETLQKLNGFNESMTYAEDPELHTRALLDKTLQYKVFKELPPDSYYRMASNLHQNTSTDIKKSVDGRIQFVISIYNAIQEKYKGKDRKKLTRKLSKAYKDIVSHFFNNSNQEFIQDFNRISSFCLDNGIIYKYEYNYSKAIFTLWNKDYAIIRRLHIKGLLTQLYLFFI